MVDITTRKQKQTILLQTTGRKDEPNIVCYNAVFSDTIYYNHFNLWQLKKSSVASPHCYLI